MRSSYVSKIRMLSLTFGVVVTIGTDPRAAEPGPAPGTPTDPSAPPEDHPPVVNPPVNPPVERSQPPAETDPAGSPIATATLNTAKKSHEPSAWRGSEIAYRNSATAYSFDKGAQLSYNPTWVMALELAPRYSFSKMISLAASLELDREVTNSDDTTSRGETVVSDLTLALTASKWATIPGDITVSSTLALTLPTSEASRGDTLIMALAPSVRLAKTFPKVLDGLSLGYTLRFTKNFHSYTTSELDSPLIATCFANSLGSCDRFLNTGGRNVSFRLSNSFDLSLDMTNWLTFSTSFGVGVSWLYDAVSDDRVTFQPIESTDSRYSLVADLGFSVRPWQPLEVRLGASTINPQLKPDGDRYAPYFNRYTEVYLDLRLDVAELVNKLVAQED
ncbi:MAG: hypothetical protein U1F43_28465 [Myxococcota bacterium]